MEQFRLTPAMSSRKLQALAVIRRYIAKWEASPSLGEIAGALGVSRQRALKLVRALEKDGLVTRTPGQRRSLELTAAARPFSRDEVLAELAAEGWRVVGPDGTPLQGRAAARPDATTGAARPDATTGGALTKEELTRLPTLDHPPGS